MDKKALYHLWTKIRPVKVWYLLVLLILFGTVSVLALRANNLKMVELREQVYEVDKQGGDVEAALQQLRAHVISHMNTDLSGGNTAVYPPIQLKYTYQRLQQSERDKAQAENANIYTAAQQHCEARNPSGFSGSNRIPCIDEYVSSRGVQVRTIPDALYKFDFASPKWSFDMAGVSLMLSGFLALALVLRIIAGRLARRL